jgi:hypothetical protein
MNEPQAGYNESQNPAQSRMQQARVSFVILGITVLVYILQEMTRMGILREPFLLLNQLILGNAVFQALM